MTTRPTDDPPPDDPRFDTAWRTASNEEPPPALDAAILARAHREVGAKPQRLSAHAAMRAHRRWWPLAAAATIAVIAIGVVQRAGHDDLVAPPSGSGVVSDIPAEAARRVAAPGERAAEASAPAPARGAVDVAPSASGGIAEGRARRDSVAPQASADTQSGSRSEAQRRAAPGATAALQKKAEPVASAPAPSEKKSATPTSAVAPLAEPFPAGKTERDAAAVAPAMPTSPAAPTESAASSLPPGASFAEGGRIAAPAGARASPAARSALAGASEETRIKDRAPLPVADWIALIRRLRAEGNTAEAARELAAFRSAHADHEALLPRDLRDWHPAGK